MSNFYLNPILTPPCNAPQQISESTQKEQVQKPFCDVLNAALKGGVEFSKHAVTRLEERGISLNDCDIEKLSSAVNKASEKGVHEPLILLNGTAFIVSVKDRKVVTAMPTEEARENVFTNIDGAVIA